jgi:hypothetical protein
VPPWDWRREIKTDAAAREKGGPAGSSGERNDGRWAERLGHWQPSWLISNQKTGKSRSRPPNSLLFDFRHRLCLSTSGAAPLRAQVVVGTPNGTVVAPAPAVPVAPTPGGERRAVRREDRRIDRNDPAGTLRPTVRPNGIVTATPAARAYSHPPSYYNNGFYRRGVFGRRGYYY